MAQVLLRTPEAPSARAWERQQNPDLMGDTATLQEWLCWACLWESEPRESLYSRPVLELLEYEHSLRCGTCRGWNEGSAVCFEKDLISILQVGNTADFDSHFIVHAGI